MVRVRTSKLVERKQKNSIGHGWKFKLHINEKLKIDYFICLGMDESSLVQSLYILPAEEIVAKQTVSINANKEENSKYYKYKIDIDDLHNYNFK